MNVRARLSDPDEWFYPDNNTPAKLAEFYGVLEGYRLKGREYELNWGTGVTDKSQTEAYSGDQVEIRFTTERNTTTFPNDVERGDVEFIDGCFVIVNKDGFLWDLGNTFMDDGSFELKIIGNVYDQ